MISAIGRFVLVACSVPCGCIGQSTLETVRSGVPGIQIIGPSDPLFTESLRRAAVPGSLPELAPGLPYCVVVSNSASRAVNYLLVRFRLTHPNGAYSSNYAIVDLRDSDQRFVKPKLVPGGAKLVCLVRGYSDIVAVGKSTPEWKRRFEAELARYTSHDLPIEASLDAIVFEDGQFAGPDTGKSFDALTTRNAARWEFITRLYAAPPYER